MSKARLIITTQQYLHTLPEADAKNLDALRMTRGQLGASPGLSIPKSSQARISTAATRRTSKRHSK